MAVTMSNVPVKADTKTAALNTIQDAQTTQDQEKDVEKSDTAAFDKQDIASLLEAKKIVISNQEKLTVKQEKSGSGIVLSGSATDIRNTVFTFSEAFDFQKGVVGRLELDAMCTKDNMLKAAFYLDQEKEPFATVQMAKQKKKGKWYTKSRSVSVYDKKITGVHTVSFKIITDNDKAAEYLLRSVTLAKSTIPVVYFNIDESQGTIAEMNNDSEHNTECYGAMTVEVPDDYRCEYADKNGKTDNIKTQTYALDHIRGRGNSTWGAEKKPYKIKLAEKADLFHMGKNKHWVLLADYYDPSHIRNKITYWMGAQMHQAFTPQGVYVDVVMNGEYYGSYMLTEQVRVGKERVNVDDLDETEESQKATDEPTISGGYLLSMCPHGTEEKQVICTSRENAYLIESPTFEDYFNEAQYNYIQDYVQKTEDAIYGTNFKLDGGVSYREYLDVPSSIDYYWMQEFSMNGDAYASPSSYLYKERKGKLFWGPLWDFDYVSWGNNDYECDSYRDWQLRGNGWLKQLFKDETFAAEAVARWKDFRSILVEASKDGGQIDAYADQIKWSMKYNNNRYGSNYDKTYDDKTFSDSVEQLKQWIQKRIQWVDENVETLPMKSYHVTFKDGNKVLNEVTVGEMEDVVLPEEPKKAGYAFAGWYVKNDDGEYELTAGNSVSSDTVAYVKWVKETEITPVEKIVFGYEEHRAWYSKWDDESERTERIPYTVIGGRGDYEKLEWSSSDPSVATVDEAEQGKVFFKSAGTVQITAQTKDGKVKASCKLKIFDHYGDGYVAMKSFRISNTDAVVKKGEKTVISCIPQPLDANGGWFEFASTDESVVRVASCGNSVIVTGVSEGKAQIVCMCYLDEERKIKTIDVTVTKDGKMPQKVETVSIGEKAAVGKLNYKVTSITQKGGTVAVTGLQSKAKPSSLVIPSQIKWKGKSYKVTEITKNAFASHKTIKEVRIGKNVKKIGDKAFYQCTLLKKVTYKNKKAPKLGKNVYTKTAYAKRKQ